MSGIDQRQPIAEADEYFLAGAMVLAQDDGELPFKASIQVDAKRELPVK